MKRWLRRALRGITFAMAAVSMSTACSQNSPRDNTTASDPIEIITFGTNTHEWNEALGVTALRLGCSRSPEACLAVALSHAREQLVEKVFLTVTLSERSPEEMSKYSKLAMNHDEFIQVGIDDFVGQYARLAKVANFPSEVLESVIANLKSIRSDLKFGITLYEDELGRDLLQALPVRVRAQVDDVHLYLHYRHGGLNYESYVDQAKMLFPNARIIAGSYAYDRIDYISCSAEVEQACSIDEEIDLFDLSLTIQLALLQQRKVNGIEFYPARFGLESAWHGWKNSALCKPKRRERCIENTVRLRRIVREKIAAFRTADIRS